MGKIRFLFFYGVLSDLIHFTWSWVGSVLLKMKPMLYYSVTKYECVSVNVVFSNRKTVGNSDFLLLRSFKNNDDK